ncbi:hypothetical protein [Dinghuibacter silviterrae]|uniref:Phage derived Gp49-like protein DUF891 n=1 Tax=Dinghuibacter silviterrae TaxID=1539049 RepID=A0A4R8DJU8_9BACT|nr:hypothetical protein [Dinghuibacter silviterrae]TDW97594.1 hypothetical protein EDB95_5445 [Dinghuibacter silviterrae]
MAKFVLKNIGTIKGIQQTKQLVIVEESADIEKIQAEINKTELNGGEAEIPGIFDAYRESLEKKYDSPFRRLLTIMERVANNQPVPADKFKDVTPQGELVKEFEFKYQDLRVYAIKIPNGKLILLGGYKNQQKSDFTRFRSVKTKFLKQHEKK